MSKILGQEERGKEREGEREGRGEEVVVGAY